jgi:CubicO group peptidase (beta-lactamase class C family)
MMEMRIIGFLLLLSTAMSITGLCQTKPMHESSTTVERIEAGLDGLEKAGFAGSVLVAIDGKKLLSKGYGFRDLEQKLKNTPNTVFDIGSVTKQFTAAAILKLEMQGKLTTNDKLSMYFKDVPKDKAGITIHQLLRHSSGLPGALGGDYERITEAGFLDTLMKTPLKFESNTGMSYSNIGYSLLAMIVERVSGLTYEEYLYQNLWKPSGMESTGYSRPRFDSQVVATGYRNDAVWGKPTEKAWDNDAPYWHLKGNGGILSTVEDLYKWNLALLSDNILSKEAKQKYYHPKLRADEDSNSYYAYGWDVHKTGRNTVLLWHNGVSGAFYADFYRFIDEGVTIIMLWNKALPNSRLIDLEIPKMIFDSSYIPNIPVANSEANRSFTDEIIRITTSSGLAKGLEAYNKRGHGIDLIENTANDKAYDLLNRKEYQHAIDLFELNVAAHPRSSNAFDSLGEAYLEAGNTELAITNYRKSVSLNPDNRNAIEILKKLTKK